MVFDSDNNMARMTRLVKYTDYKSRILLSTLRFLFDVGQTVSIKDRLRAEDTVDGGYNLVDKSFGSRSFINEYRSVYRSRTGDEQHGETPQDLSFRL